MVYLYMADVKEKTYFRLSLPNEETKELLKKRAAREGIVVSQYIMRCVKFYEQSQQHSESVNVSKNHYMLHVLNNMQATLEQLVDINEKQMEMTVKNNRQLWSLFGGEAEALLAEDEKENK